jgi:alpha-L-rhamnosidase
VVKGATTIWETWTGIDERGVPSGSLNHYSYGAVVGWLMDTVAGIDMDPATPGFSRFLIAPKPDGTMRHAEGR